MVIKHQIKKYNKIIEHGLKKHVQQKTRLYKFRIARKKQFNINIF